MKFFVNNLLNVCLFLDILCSFGSSQSYFYEQMHHFGLGRRMIQNYRRTNAFRNRNEYPEPLPSPAPGPNALIPSPYHNIYQGKRHVNDTRVYRRQFEYDPQPSGHHVFCQGSFSCTISHIAVETAGGIPYLLRGGAGYTFFEVVAKAKPWDELKGSVRAYCLNKPNEYYAT